MRMAEERVTTELLQLEDGEETPILTLEEQGRLVGDVRERGVKLSTIDGYTIHRRPGRRPRIHLLRPYSRCLQNVPPEMLEQIEGSREMVADAISDGGIPCEKCFPKEVSVG